MKNKIILLISLFIGIIVFTLSNSYYTSGKISIGILLSVIGVLFISLYSVMLGNFILNKLKNNNDLIIGGLSLIIYTITYTIYMSIFNILPNLNPNIFGILLVIFYLSFLTMVLSLSIIFYFWNYKNKKKSILYFIVINLTILICLIIGSKLFTNLPELVSSIIGFLYFTGVILLLLYIIVFIIFKIVKPTKK